MAARRAGGRARRSAQVEVGERGKPGQPSASLRCDQGHRSTAARGRRAAGTQLKARVRAVIVRLPFPTNL